MKKILIGSLFIVLCLAPLACIQHFPVGPAPNLPPTSTPTPNLTPVCGFTTYSLGTIALDASPNVIRSVTDWQTFNSYPTGMLSLTPTVTPVIPAPPVNFATQMLIVMIVPVCASSNLTVTNVCEGPNQITISANNVQACAICNVGASWGFAAGIAVPQSSLPIVWNINQIPCVMGVDTPTPTP
jgi:hypothetical protein